MNKGESVILTRCELCPRQCGANRLAGQKGYCGAGDKIVIAHYGPHFGEEPPISGTKGSGNIFFALETCGCHNINLVSPVPYILHIATAIREAKKRGLAISFVYNTNAYENVEALQMLDGLIDIYLPDFKYWNTTIAERLSGVPKGKPYPVFAKKAILEMKRQVGDLVVEDGIAQGGLVVRHLVLPGRLAGSKEIFTWIARNLGTGTFIGLMSQYYPLYEAKKYPILQRKIRQEEYDTLMERLLEKGFKNVFIQELESAALFVPDFEKTEPFKTVRSSGL